MQGAFHCRHDQNAARAVESCTMASLCSGGKQEADRSAYMTRRWTARLRWSCAGSIRSPGSPRSGCSGQVGRAGLPSHALLLAPSCLWCQAPAFACMG